MRLLKVRMLDGAIKSMMVDDSQIVTNMMVIICTKIGITNHDEYSLVREKVEEEQENVTPNKKYGTLGGTLTLGRKHKKNQDPSEPALDPKMATLRKNLHTEDGGKEEGRSCPSSADPQRFLSAFPFPFLCPPLDVSVPAPASRGGGGLSGSLPQLAASLVVTSFFLSQLGGPQQDTPGAGGRRDRTSSSQEEILLQRCQC